MILGRSADSIGKIVGVVLSIILLIVDVVMVFRLFRLMKLLCFKEKTGKTKMDVEQPLRSVDA